jgi:rhodanese-related sulfurtransferase
VYCNSGARAAAAVSLLEREGLQAIDVNDPFANYRSADQTVATHA